MWRYVIPHFEDFLANLELTDNQREDAQTKVHNIGRCLYKEYYLDGGDGKYNPNRVLVVGSYGKRTAVRPPSDIDMLFLLSPSEYSRIDTLQDNGQSQLLQEVKRALDVTFPDTAVSADGQVIRIPFSSYNVELVPAFKLKSGGFYICDTNQGGSWTKTNPLQEYQAIKDADYSSLGKATDLIKMLKAWKTKCNVDIKSIVLEISACYFIQEWLHKDMTIFWYDWMIRDYFKFMLNYKNGSASIPGIDEKISLGSSWFSKCETAYTRAFKACEYEKLDMEQEAANEWKKIFGDQFIRIGG